MKYIEKNNSVIISEVTDFNPEHTFMCGQCFRWEKETDDSFTGVAFSKVVNISASDDTFTIKNITLKEFETYWKTYLDLDCDYTKIKNGFSNDIHVSKAMEFGWGIRILNQEIFECLISFILSTQNTIPRIKKIISKLSELYGEKIVFENREYYTFPTLESLTTATLETLEPLKAGYRADYVIDAVDKINSGEVSLDNLIHMPYEEAKKELMKIKGVGPKVADCVLLFSCGKKEAFPIDVWVDRTVKNLYLDDSATHKQITEFAKNNFGANAGVAQQYLFYYARENKQ